MANGNNNIRYNAPQGRPSRPQQGYDPRMQQQGRPAQPQQNRPAQPQYGYDPRMQQGRPAQPQYGYDPRMQQGYPPQQQPYGYDPRQAQGYAPRPQYGYDPQMQQGYPPQQQPYPDPVPDGPRRKSPLKGLLLGFAGLLFAAAIALVVLNFTGLGSRAVTYDTSADRGADELLTLGADAYQSGDYDAAITLLSAVLADTDDSVSASNLAAYREAAVIGIADSYAAEGNPVRAQQTLVEYGSCILQNDTESLVAMYAGGTTADVLAQFADGGSYTAALAEYSDAADADDGSYQAVLNAYANTSADSMLADIAEAEGMDFAYSLDNTGSSSRRTADLPFSAWTVTQLASDSRTKVWYATADLDGDSSDELLIGTGRSSGSVTLSEIYTMSGGSRVRLLARTDTLSLRLLSDRTVLGTLSGTSGSTSTTYALSGGSLTSVHTYSDGDGYTADGITVSKGTYNSALDGLTDAALAWTQIG